MMGHVYVTFRYDRHRMVWMLTRSIVLAAVMTGIASALQSTPVDTSKLGPQVGSVVPAFEGLDQFGNRRNLSSLYGPKGAMLVFFRSADW
jgi:hypothetical protein